MLWLLMSQALAAGKQRTKPGSPQDRDDASAAPHQMSRCASYVQRRHPGGDEGPASNHPDGGRVFETLSWPGPVGWWYFPLFWLVALLFAALAWSFN